ncbi:MAG: cytochrome B [Hyphomicrobiales bacterium]|nr:MAG: cytochrome B [Hyphomicrobiales bacterium]
MSELSTTPISGRDARPDEVRVWDLPVRLFHWSLLAAFAFAWITADEWDRPHEWAGYVVAGLVAFRLVWGFVGPAHARFSDFVHAPGKIIAYLRDMQRGKAKRSLGHNPAGGAMILALLAGLIGISVTGYAMTTNMFWGVEWVEELHEIIATLTLIMAGLHVAGVLYSSLAHRENLIRAMITGRKRTLESDPIPPAAGA